jgi:hypothetical protein
MKAPTTAEVKRGYDGITADGEGAEITMDLSLLAVTNPLIADTISRMVRAAAALGVQGDYLQVQGLLCGALVYGLHMGLHIGEARARERL